MSNSHTHTLPLFPSCIETDNGEIFHLPKTEGLVLFQQFIPLDEADTLLSRLMKQSPWQQDTLTFGGKTVAVPRLQAWMADAGLDYGYSGLKLKSVEWQEPLTSIRHSLASKFNMHFNSVLINLYRNGNDSVAWHSDDEPELGPAPVIASLSLGETRRFDLKRKHEARNDIKTLALAHGDLLIMKAGVQNHYQHRIPKQKEINLPRINLTFREIFHSSGMSNN